MLSTAFISCAGSAASAKTSGTSGLCVHVPKTQSTPQNRAAQYAVSDLEVFTVIVKSGSFSKSKSCSQDEVLEFTDLPVGHYNVTAFAKKADGTVTGRGDATSVDIEADVIKEVTITIHRLTHYTVQFHNDAAAAPTSVEVGNGEKVTKPANPTRSGHWTFGGWYTSSDGGTTLSAAYNFNTPVTTDLDLYPKWSIDYTGLASGDILAADGNWFAKNDFDPATDSGNYIAWNNGGTWYAVTNVYAQAKWAALSATPSAITGIGGSWLLPDKDTMISFLTSETSLSTGYNSLFGSSPWSIPNDGADANLIWTSTEEEDHRKYVLLPNGTHKTGGTPKTWGIYGVPAVGSIDPTASHHYVYMCPLTLP